MFISDLVNLIKNESLRNVVKTSLAYFEYLSPTGRQSSLHDCLARDVTSPELGPVKLVV